MPTTGRPTAMRVHLFDAALRHPTGHHADWALRIAHALARRGHAVAVWGAQGLDPDLSRAIGQGGVRCAGLFSHHAHDGVPDGIDTQGLRALAATAAREIGQAGPADLLLFPSISPLNLAALAQLDHPQPAAGMLHLSPAQEHAGAAELWTWAQARLRARAQPVRLGAMDPEIGATWATLPHAAPVEHWPQPIDGVVRPGDGVLRSVGFFGHQRPERGKAWIPALTRALLGGGLRVIVHDSRGDMQADRPVAGLKLIRGFVRDLAPVLGECDLVICPMAPDLYRLRTSGIASLALACGRPLLLPEGTLAARRFEPTGAVACFEAGRIDSLLAAVQRMAREFPARQAAARAAAQAWARTQGVERFVDAVLGQDQPGPDPA